MQHPSINFPKTAFTLKLIDKKDLLGKDWLNMEDLSI